MGRIEEAIRQSRKSRARQESPVPITDAIEPENRIEISELPVVIPDEDQLRKHQVVAALKDAPERRAYKVLRTRVLQRLRASNFNIIGITASGPGEGKTLTAINFAYSLAQDVNHQVILLDLDLRRPSVHEYLGITPPRDLTDVLEESTSLRDALICPNANRLGVLTCQRPFRDSSEILSSPQMASVIQQLRNQGDRTITVVDLPPVLASDDVIAVSPLVDTLLLVVGQGQCRREELKETQELLKDSEILGVVLNRSREKTAGTGYYDYY